MIAAASAVIAEVLLASLRSGLVAAPLLWLALRFVDSRRSTVRYLASCSALAVLVAGAFVPSDAAARVLVAARSRDWLDAAPVWIASGWLAGVLAQCLLLARSVRRIAAIRERTTPIDDFPELQRIAGRCRELASAMRVRAAAFRITSAELSPFSCGLFRPAIILPLTLLTRLSEDEVEAIVAHEIGHIRRHDHLVNTVQVACETVLFFNPFVWWISARIREEREHCADDDAARTSNPLLYARALYRAATHGAPALAIAAASSRLESRIARLLGEAHPASHGLPVALLVLAFAVIAGVRIGPPAAMTEPAPWYVREAVVAEAATKRTPEAFETLVVALGDENWSIRHRAIRALREHGPAAAEPLAVHIDDPNWALRSEIVTTLGEIGDPKTLPLVRTRLDDENSSVRAAAIEALVRLTRGSS